MRDLSVNALSRLPLVRFLRRAGARYPLTLPGTVLFVIAVALLLSGYTSDNNYDLAIALVSFLALGGLAVGGHLQAARLRHVHITWTPAEQWTAGKEEHSLVVGAKLIRPRFLYRVHCAFRGVLHTGERNPFYVSQVTSSAGGRDIELLLRFPFSGELHATGIVSFRDMFGLTRAQVASSGIRHFVVLPSSFSGSRAFNVHALGGYEEETTRTSSDSERYYMREYVPGDRMRDINWKATSRLSQLITRVSPQTQEKTQVIPVEFRHYAEHGARDTARSLAHLDTMKSWVLAFMRAVKEENPSYQFRVRTAWGETRLESDTDIDRFAVELSSIGYETEPQRSVRDPELTELYIFSTPFDRNLGAALAHYRGIRTHIFRTSFPAPRRTPDRPRSSSEEAARRSHTVTLFGSPAYAAIPGPWVLRRSTVDGGSEEAARAVRELGSDLRQYPVDVRLL
jgi:uncharacterized protein (DUF58 family)